jgi:hypothetical protein
MQNITESRPRLLMLSTLLAFYSCQSPVKTTPATTKSDSIVSDTSHAFMQTQASATEIIEDTVADIRFHEFSVSINRLLVYDQDHELSNLQKDTVILDVEPGETIEGQKITVSSDQLSDIKIEQSYETSITIMEEGPHWDLTEWKHYNSEWKQLTPDIHGQFTGNSYTEKEREVFPKIDINELKKYVKDEHGNAMYTYISKIKSPTEYPSGVGISRYFLRISGRDKNTGKSITKLIIILAPMGC